ncbi:MAG: hypothetical protein LBE36_13340 [Flavobacteriaceae bacterium]|nr:hypothetical protein [Flavobacteriaceae bacterium]
MTQPHYNKYAVNIDYQIAKEYLNKLTDSDKVKLCNRTLGEVNERKLTKTELRKYYQGYVKKKILKN